MTTTINDVNYFDPDTHSFVNGSVTIENGRIKALESSETGTIIDGKGKYLIPGLIDSHIHFFQSAGLFTRPDGLDLRKIKSYKQEFEDIKNSLPDLFRRYLATGVTGVVDCGGPFWNFEVKEQVKAPAPEIAVAGPLVSTVSREKLDLGDPPIIKADSTDHARELVRKCVEMRPAFVKFWFIHQEDRFEEDSKIMEAGMDECKKLGARIAVHATELETARRSVQYGADILVHSVFNEDIDEDFVQLLKDKDVIYIPTLMVRNGYRDVYRSRLFLSDYEQRWGDPQVIASFERLILLDKHDIPETHRGLRDEHDKQPQDLTETAYNNLKRLHEAGVTIATGTDAGNVGTLHGPSLHIEMEHMVNAGMSPADVIVATTKNAAKVLAMDDIGEIRPGMRADLVLLSQNPLDDIKATRTIDMVFKDGKPLRPTELIQPFDPVTIVQGQMDAYNDRDLDRFLSYYHPRVKIHDFQSGELLIDGIDAMRERYRKLFANSPELHAELKNRIALGAMVIDHERVSGHGGRKYPIEAIAYNEVRHQKITRVFFSR